MKRYLDDLIAQDLMRKMVLVTGPRQVGKTTLCRHLMARLEPAQSLNWDVAGDRAVLQRQSGDSLAGRYLAYRLHPISARARAGAGPDHAARRFPRALPGRG